MRPHIELPWNLANRWLALQRANTLARMHSIKHPGVMLAVSATLAACGATGAAGHLETETPATSVSAREDAPSGMIGTLSNDGPAGSARADASVVRFDDPGLSYAIPAGWRVVGDDTLIAGVRRSDGAVAEEIARRLEQKQGVPLLTLTNPLAMTVILAVVPVDNGSQALESLRDQSHKLDVALHERVLQNGPSPLTRFGVAGAEMTDRHLTRTKDGGESRVKQVMRLFIRGAQGILLSVMWRDSLGDRPPEVTTMLEALKFYAPSSLR